MPYILYISSVYSLFSDGVGLPSCVLMRSLGADILRLDAFPDVNHIRGMY